MKRVEMTNYINEKFAILQVRISARGKINVLDFHIHSENFYRDLLNILYNWKLENINEHIQNVEAIDLEDASIGIIVQVSATATKQKIENSLNKESLKEYAKKGYSFKFISVSKPADNLRNKKYKNPYHIKFDPKNDILDIQTIEKSISNLEIDEMENVFSFIKKELGITPDIIRLDSDLTSIINILSKTNLNDIEVTGNINSFQIEKKIKFNHLNLASVLIEDYKIYFTNLDKKYKEFDKMGVNKSIAVLQAMRKIYINAMAKEKYKNDDQLFLGIIDEVKEIVLKSSNFFDIPVEELDICVSILVVDAFIRCKIFKNPEGYKYVIT